MAAQSNKARDESGGLDLSKAKIIRRGPKHPLGPKLPLRVLRESRGLTQADVAEASGMDQSEISRVWPSAFLAQHGAWSAHAR